MPERRNELSAATRSECLTSRYVLTLDFQLGRETWPRAERFIYADSDADAVKQARKIIKREARERKGGWTPIPATAQLVSVVTLTEPVEMAAS